MKRILCGLMILAVVFTAACGVSVTTETISLSIPAETSEVVAFADPMLEARVCAAMGRPKGNITAAEAEAVTEMNFGIEWQQDISEETQIRDIGGLEYFQNLESLNLSFHAIADISPLAGLSKLTSLSLGSNPVADISPLSGMTNLRKLTLSDCTAQDYRPLTGLINLEILVLDNSTITDLSALSGMTGLTYLSLAHTQASDISPLAGLTGLKQLYLTGCPVDDYSPLAGIYANLEGKDFTVPSSLKELGFTWPENDAVAEYRGEEMSVTVNHSEWGAPGMEDQNNAVKMNLQMDNGYGLTVIYYPKIDVYVFQMTLNNEMIMNYIYEEATGEFSLNASERGSMEQVLIDALGETDADDILLTPVPIFNDTIRETFGMTADALFALPFEPPSLRSFGFIPDEANAACIYEQYEGRNTSIEVHRPEWGEQEYSIHFFTLINGYGVMARYYQDQ